jgi:hypothetical protein
MVLIKKEKIMFGYICLCLCLYFLIGFIAASALVKLTNRRVNLDGLEVEDPFDFFMSCLFWPIIIAIVVFSYPFIGLLNLIKKYMEKLFIGLLNLIKKYMEKL